MNIGVDVFEWDEVQVEAGDDAEHPVLIVESVVARDDGAIVGAKRIWRIVELHRGNIVVESQKGKGTEFRLFLPIFE